MQVSRITKGRKKTLKKVSYILNSRPIREGLDSSINEQNIIFDLALMVPSSARNVFSYLMQTSRSKEFRGYLGMLAR